MSAEALLLETSAFDVETSIRKLYDLNQQVLIKSM